MQGRWCCKQHSVIPLQLVSLESPGQAQPPSERAIAADPASPASRWTPAFHGGTQPAHQRPAPARRHLGCPPPWGPAPFVTRPTQARRRAGPRSGCVRKRPPRRHLQGRPPLWTQPPDPRTRPCLPRAGTHSGTWLCASGGGISLTLTPPELNPCT